MLAVKVADINIDDVKAKAEEAIKKALALDPNLAEAHTSFGFLKEMYIDPIGSNREYRRAIELNPNYALARHWYSENLYKEGRLEEALVEAKKAVELEPFSTNNNFTLGVILTWARQYPAAIQYFQRTIELDANIVTAWFELWQTFIFLEEFEHAKNAAIRLAELTGADKEMSLLFISLIEEHARTGEAVSPPPELVEFFSKVPVGYLILYANLGHKEKIIENAELFEQRDIRFLSELKNHPYYDFVRSEPRFIELIQKIEQELGQ